MSAVLDFEFKTSEGKDAFDRGNRSAPLSSLLVEVPDFVAKMNEIKKSSQQIISFSLEHGSDQECLQRAAKKKAAKGSDFAVVNPISDESGPDSEKNRGFLLYEDHCVQIPHLSKDAFAWEVLQKVEEFAAN